VLLGQSYEDSGCDHFDDDAHVITDTDDVTIPDVLKNTATSDVIDDVDLSPPHDSLSYDSFR